MVTSALKTLFYQMTRTRVAIIVFTASVAAAVFPRAAWAECYLENVASPQEIADGWTIHEDLRVVKQVDSAPYEQGGRGNWFVDREKTTLPLCSVFDDLGAYSLRSYMLQPVVTKVQVKICQATAGGGSVPFVPADAKPQPSDTAHEVFDSYKRPYAGPCPPVRPAPVPVPRSRNRTGRHAVLKRGTNNFDLNVTKSIPIGEARRLELRWEALNAFNHPQFVQVPQRTVNGTPAGRFLNRDFTAAGKSYGAAKPNR